MYISCIYTYLIFLVDHLCDVHKDMQSAGGHMEIDVCHLSTHSQPVVIISHCSCEINITGVQHLEKYIAILLVICQDSEFGILVLRHIAAKL